MTWFDILKDKTENKVTDMFSDAFKKPTDKLNTTEDRTETAQNISDASKRKHEREIEERKRKELLENRRRLSQQNQESGSFIDLHSSKPTDDKWEKILQRKSLLRFKDKGEKT